MRITGNDSEKAILTQLGERIKQYRISLNITQSELAEKCGISLSTLARMENGEDTKFSNVIKILAEFNLSDNLDLLIPEPKPDYKAIFEEKSTRKRARPDKKGTNNAWVWGEDKGDEA